MKILLFIAFQLLISTNALSWEIEKSIDPLNDEPFGQAHITSKQPFVDGPVNPLFLNMAIICKPAGWNTGFYVDEPHIIDDVFQIHYRIGKSLAKKTSPSESHQTVILAPEILNDKETFSDLLTPGATIFVRAISSFQVIEGHFELDGISGAINDIGDHCEKR